MTGFQSIVLTGASGGIGHALASRLAADGRHLLLVGRDPDRLAEAREAAAAKGAAVETAPLDVTETARLAEALLAFDDRRPVDLVIAGAGISSGTKPDGAPEGLDALRRVIEVNLLGAAATIEPLIPRMVARGHGRIVVIGSVAAHRPLPDMPAYSASKAALRAWATAIRGRLAPQGVGVTIVSPGFVTSAMSRRHLGIKPFEIGAEAAASKILRGLERGDALITFPWQLSTLAWLGSRLPPRLSDLAIKGFATRIEPDRDRND